MIVDQATLSVAPIADHLIAAADAAARDVTPSEGNPESDPEFGAIGWSNELARHVVEFKTAEPARSLTSLTEEFQSNIRRANELLEPLHARLMPGAMHPWMDPLKEMQLWPHGFKDVYQAFDRIFSCKGHGWANLQSMHINLPFCGDEEFGRLHAAIRLVLPILPALAASSPVMEARATGLLDNRLEVYRFNSKRIPSVAGKVIPEPVYTQQAYTSTILERIWADLAPLDPEGILRDEWANARGCIARFSRGSIEIRVIDVQECPAADLAICQAVVALVQMLTRSPLSDQQGLREWSVEALHEIFLSCVRSADDAVISNLEYIRQLGVATQRPLSARELWFAISEQLPAESVTLELQTILRHGCLARRILRASGVKPSQSMDLRSDETMKRLHDVYGELTNCLAEGRMFIA
ncbi:MAG: glutamate--cysteine ligase [Pyrinomonadaceae bacterium]|nr:glutamate--cysteine ligase [Phycisphaerales bacterium]